MKWIKCKDRLPESNGGFYLRNAPELFASLEMDRDGHTIALSVYDPADDEMVYMNSWDLSKRPDCPWEWLDESTPERERDEFIETVCYLLDQERFETVSDVKDFMRQHWPSP